MAVDSKIRDKYEATIGIECHVQLKTKTKLFAGVSNDAREAEQNTLVSPICFGMPGVLPVLNSEAVELAIRAGIALNAEVAEFSKFDRKHYFYPDLPMGYQITQFDEPTIGKGEIDVPMEDGSSFRVRITRAHMEADAGKSTHPNGADYSLVDLNRAGTPLIEIVSEADMHSAKQARAYAKELYFLMKYAGVSDVDLYHGNMRFDVNVSVALKDSDKLGTRTETKNLNSFKSIERASDFEIDRQIEVIESGGSIRQETRGWDDDKAVTFSQRDKEDAHDYRYFPDPDLPPIEIETSHIDEVRASMPMLPPEIRTKLSGAGIELSVIDTLLGNEHWIDILLTCMEEKPDDKKALKKLSNWLVGDVKAEAQNGNDKYLTYNHLIELYDMVSGGSLSSSGAKEVLVEILSNKGGSAKEIAENKKLIQVSDSGAIDEYVNKVLEANPQAVSDIKNGEMKAIGFLVGQVMKESKGQANPSLAKQAIEKKIDQL